jgi:hypothetical protein
VLTIYSSLGALIFQAIEGKHGGVKERRVWGLTKDIYSSGEAIDKCYYGVTQNGAGVIWASIINANCS